MSILGNLLKDLLGKKPGQASLSTTTDSSPAGIDVDSVRQMSGGSIIAFYATSEGNALAQLTRSVLTPVATRASGLTLIDVNNPGWLGQLREALQQPVWFAFSFFGVGQELEVRAEGRVGNLWDVARVPFVRIYGDIPAYFPDKHVRLHKNSINAYADPRFQRFYQRWFDAPAMTVLMRPLPMELQDLSMVDRQAKMRGKLIYPKNGNSLPKLVSYWRSAFPGTVARMLESIGEECVSEANVDKEPMFDDLLLAHAQRASIDLASDRVLMCFLVAQLDDYVRRFKSTLMAQAMLDLPVIVRGRNWEHIDFAGRRAVLDGNSDYESTQPLFDAAPAVIDMSPNTMHSMHDRILRAIGRGTAFLTNQQDFLDEHLGTDLRCTFRFRKQDIAELVEHYVTHPAEAIDMGLEPGRSLRAAFTEAAQADRLVEAVDLMTLRLASRPFGTQNFVDFPPRLFR